MSKKNHVLFGGVFFLLVCVLALAQQVKKKSDVLTPKKQPVPVQQRLIRDIAIDDIFLDDQCKIWVRWKNMGNVRIEGHLREKVFIHGTALESCSMNHVLLEPGAVFAHSVGANPGLKLTSPGTVTAVIDADNVLSENNKQNNSLTKTLSCVGAMPDLMITQTGCATLQAYVNSQGRNCRVFEVIVYIKNSGTSDITNSFKVSLERDSGPNRSFVPFGSYTVPGLTAGATLLLEPKRQADTCFWYMNNPGLGDFLPRIRIIVDSENSVPESLENNNQTIISCSLQ